MIDSSDKVFGATETEGAMTDGFNLVIHSFHGAIRNAVPSPRQDSIEVRAEHAHEFLERFQARAHSRAHPFLQMVLGPFRLSVLPEQLKGLFEVVGPHDGRVPTDQGREAFLLLASEIPGVLQQQPPAAFEYHSFP